MRPKLAALVGILIAGGIVIGLQLGGNAAGDSVRLQEAAPPSHVDDGVRYAYFVAAVHGTIDPRDVVVLVEGVAVQVLWEPDGPLVVGSTLAFQLPLAGTERSLDLRLDDRSIGATRLAVAAPPPDYPLELRHYDSRPLAAGNYVETFLIEEVEGRHTTENVTVFVDDVPINATWSAEGPLVAGVRFDVALRAFDEPRTLRLTDGTSLLWESKFGTGAGTPTRSV